MSDLPLGFVSHSPDYVSKKDSDVKRVFSGPASAIHDEIQKYKDALQYCLGILQDYECPKDEGDRLMIKKIKETLDV